MTEPPFRIQTPESVDLALEPAGIGSRFLGWVVDSLIQAAIILVIFVIAILVDMSMDFLSELTDSLITAMVLLVVGAVLMGYRLLLEALWNGQTVGKRVAGIRVVQVSGLPVTFPQILIRNLIRVVDLLPLFYLVGTVALLANRLNQRLGDMAAGTVVVRTRTYSPPVLPERLTETPSNEYLGRLREHARRLSDEEMQVARTFWERQATMEPEVRRRIAWQIVSMLTERMGWTERRTVGDLHFIEQVLFVRSQP